jgi:hypothetical protein
LSLVNYKWATGIVVVLMVFGLFSPTYGAQKTLKQKTLKEYVFEGKASLEAKEFDKAITIFTDALKHYPKSIEALNGRGVAFVSKKDFPRALKDFNRSIKVDPKYGVAYVNRAIVFWCTGQSDKAEADMKKAQSLGVTVSREDLNRFLEKMMPPGKESPLRATTPSPHPQEKGQQAPASVKTYTPEEKQGYQKKMASDIAEIRKEIDKLVATWQGAGEGRKQAIRKDIVAIQQMSIRAQWKLRALEKASDKEWPYLKISMDAAMKDLIGAFSEIGGRYKLIGSGKAPSSKDPTR